ncbi:MAG TPA: ABC transporter substrate-binding protein [Alphaproteobacteria bacterium]
MRRTTQAIAALAIGLAALVAGLTPAAAADLKPWRYGVLDAKSDAGFSFMITRGFAERQGLKLEVVQLPADTQLLQALVSGEVDAFEGSPGNDIVAAARGADVKIIGCTWPGLPHAVFTRKLAAVGDLKGKNVAAGPPGSLPDLLLRILLDKSGIAAEDVKFVTIGNDLDRFKSLVAGVVDAAVVSNEVTPVATTQGVKMLAAARDFAPDYPRLCIQTTGKTLGARRDDVARFMAAEIAALRHAVSHRDETLQLAREMARMKDDDPRPAFIYDWALQTKSIDPELTVAIAKLEYIEEQLLKTGHMTKRIDIKTMVDADVRERALALAK